MAFRQDTPQGSGAVSSVAATFAGPWAAGLPGPTDGIAFDTQAGFLTMMCTATAYTAGPGIQVQVYLDQVLMGMMRLDVALTPNAHSALSVLTFRTAIAAGTHRIFYRQISGSSGADDYGSIMGVGLTA
jgi:hypothetical protein